MSATSFFSGFIMFTLISMTLSPSNIFSEQALTALKLGLFIGFILAASCLLLYFLAWLLNKSAKLFGPNS